MPDSWVSHFKSLVRFGIVGVSAVIAQACVFMLLTTFAGQSGFVASAWALIIPLMISYFGQSRWTFSDRKKRSIGKFIQIALISIGANIGASWLLVDAWGACPISVLPVILIVVPMFSYLAMRSWAFTKHEQEDC